MNLTQYLPLPYGKPPLSMNDRLHYQAKARTTKRLRQDAASLAKAHALMTVPGATVTLHWRPADNRVRDEANMHATLKPLVDGLVDAGVLINGDGSAWVDTRCVIHAAIKGKAAATWLEIQGR